MSGFEYAFAGLLLAEGMTEEARAVTRSVRDRYDGKKRNPFSEIECGSNYARPMSSFAFLPIFAGFSCDLTRGEIGFAPLTQKRLFRSFFACGGAWGSVRLNNKRFILSLAEGSLLLRRLRLPDAKKARELHVDGRRVPFLCEGDTLCFEASLKHSLSITFAKL